MAGRAGGKRAGTAAQSPETCIQRVGNACCQESEGCEEAAAPCDVTGLGPAGALSLPGTSAFTLGIMLWLIYGLAIGDWPLIGSNAATLALMAPILTMKLRYG